MAQTDLDKLVGPQPEDTVKKVWPGTEKEPSADAASKGGAAKLPDPPMPFKLEG